MTDHDARWAISDVLYRYCRGMDRMDRALTRSCWHADGTDDHAPLFVGSADGFLDWVWPVHAQMLLTRHSVTNVLMSIHGDQAGVESYWEVLLRRRVRDGLVDNRSGGRYVDRFECRDGVWAITHRHSIREWSRVDPLCDTVDPADGQTGVVPNNPESVVTRPRRDRQDYSYQVV